jgi:hypothetical protein
LLSGKKEFRQLSSDLLTRLAADLKGKSKKPGSLIRLV